MAKAQKSKYVDSRGVEHEYIAIRDDNPNDVKKSRKQKQLDKATQVHSEIQKLAPDAIIELFELQLSKFTDKDTGEQYKDCFFHAGTNGLSQPVVWRGKKYEALPIEAEGFEATTQGTLPRPKLRLANINGLFSAGVREMDDFVGCKVIRRRTFKKFLDPNNFYVDETDEFGHFQRNYYTDDRIIRDSDGETIDKNIYIDPDNGKVTQNGYTVSNKNKDGSRIYDWDEDTITFRSPYDFNPTYDPNQHYPDEIWYVEQKISETKWLIEWELSSPLDLQGVQLPRRQIIQNTCCWQYCSPECGWNRETATRWYDKDNKPTGSIKEDVCAKRLSSCELRFAGGGRSIPFGGFPGAVRYNT